MRKAKWALSAIALFAVVGAAFAFKARQSQQIYVPAPGAPANTTLCTVTLPGFTTQGLTTTTTWAAADPASPCQELGIREGL